MDMSTCAWGGVYGGVMDSWSCSMLLCCVCSFYSVSRLAAELADMEWNGVERSRSECLYIFRLSSWQATPSHGQEPRRRVTTQTHTHTHTRRNQRSTTSDSSKRWDEWAKTCYHLHMEYRSERSHNHNQLLYVLWAAAVVLRVWYPSCRRGYHIILEKLSQKEFHKFRNIVGGGGLFW